MKKIIFPTVLMGYPAFYELYKIDNAPKERNNLLELKPVVVNELKSIWEMEAADYPPPVKMGIDKWEEIAPENNN